MHTSTGLAKVKTTQGWIIIRINQGLHTEHDSNEEMDHESLFCIAQDWEHELSVNDKPQRYGGQQNIIIEEENERFIILLTYYEGICIITHIEPTDKEIKKLPIINISNHYHIQEMNGNLETRNR